jgi:uncharacterized protein (UPF0297 family)
MKKNNLKSLIFEQGVLSALKSLISPVTDAISKLDFPEDEKDAERAADWEQIQTKIQKFFEEFPQFTPESEKELDAFEKWLKRNKRAMTPNNVYSMLSKAYMGKNTDVKFANDIQKFLNNLVNAYKDDIFKNAKANEFETITKQALANSLGDLQKAKDYFLNFMLKNLYKISRYKLGVVSKGKEGVEDPIAFNSDLIARALDLPTEYVMRKIEAKIKEIEQLSKYEKEERVFIGEKEEKFITDVVDDYSKLTRVDPKDKQVVAKVRKACIDILKMEPGYDLRYEYNEAKKAVIQKLLGKKVEATTTTKTEKEKQIDEDEIDKVYELVEKRKKRVVRRIVKHILSAHPEFETKTKDLEEAIFDVAENEEIDEDKTFANIYDAYMEAVLKRMNSSKETTPANANNDDTDKVSKMKTAIEDVIKKNPPVAKLNKDQLSKLPELISVALKNNDVTEEDKLKDVFTKVYPFIRDELEKLS